MEEYKYDIFISYKHEELDKAVAAKLQKSLEHYKIPKEIQKKTGKEKIKRVFRDEEELAVSSNLGKEIEEQIIQSEYFLLVCSKKTKESQWVLKEIDTFLKYRDAEHILPVLVEGEPEESFPESILAQGEPMAADVRGKNQKEVLKNVQRELPRLVAPVLRCSYDELKQRHKVYQTYRLLGIAAIVVCFLSVFVGYVLFQAKKSEKEYQATRKNQARYLCNISGNLLQTGDRMGALKTALAISPENESGNKPIVPEQLYALNNALYSYKYDNSIEFRANRMQKLKGNIESKIKFSDEGTYCVAIDSNRYAYFFDGTTGKLIWRADSEKLTGEKTGIYVAEPLDENRAILVTERKIVTVDIKTKQQQNICNSHFEKTYTNGGINLFIMQDKAVLWDGGQVCITDLKSGKKLYYYKNQNNNIEQVIADEKGERLFLAVGGELESEKEDGSGNLVYSEKNKKDAAGIYCYTLVNKKMTRISTRATEKICLSNDGNIAAVQYVYYSYESAFIAEVTYSLSVYNINTGKRVWEQSGLKENNIKAKADCQCFDIKQNKKKKQKILVIYFKNTIYCLDADTHKLLSEKVYDAPITGIGKYDNTRLLLSLEDGSIYVYVGYDKKYVWDYSQWATDTMCVGKLENDFVIDGFSYNMKKQTAIEYGDRKIVFLNMIKDDKVNILGEEEHASKVFYETLDYSGKKETYRCVQYDENDKKGKKRVDIYKSGTNKAIYTITTAEDKEESIEGVTLGIRDEKKVVCYSIDSDGWELTDKQKSIFYMVDLQTKKVINKCEIPAGYYINSNVLYANDLTYVWMWNSKNIWSMCLTDNKLQLKKEKKWNFENNIDIDAIQNTIDDRYLIMLFHNSFANKGGYYLKIWDREEKEYKKIDGQEKINIEDKDGFAIGKKENILAISQKNEVIKIIDIDKEKVRKIIDAYKNNEETDVTNNSMSFFNNDKYLLRLRASEKILSMLDCNTGDILTEERDDFIGDELIVDNNSEYFGAKDNSLGRTKNKLRTAALHIYMLNQENETFVKYADVDYGNGSFEAKEIFVNENYITYYTDFYSFSQLKKQAEDLLDGEKLTAQEKRKYFLSGN